MIHCDVLLISINYWVGSVVQLQFRDGLVVPGGAVVLCRSVLCQLAEPQYCVSCESRVTYARLWESEQEAADHVCLQMHHVHGEKTWEKDYAYFWEIARGQPSDSISFLMEIEWM